MVGCHWPVFIVCRILVLMNSPDWRWMQRALENAERGRGTVEPNPLVGAVLVRDGELVGEGWHQAYGEAHAEIHAIAAAAGAARDATLYVTLEPCCHHGKTTPCTDAIVRAGISRVVAAMTDPFPQVAGRGAAVLRAAGVGVDVGLGEREARRLNAPYLKLLATAKPYVHAKWAMSLDGKIATRAGNSKWISGEESRRRVHELRGRMDAIVIGANTALRDDPTLTVRPPGPRTPARIVLGEADALRVESRLLTTVEEAPLMLVAATDPHDSDVKRLKEAGCELLVIRGDDESRRAQNLLTELGRRRLTNILVEGGSQILGSFHDAGAIDEVHVFIAPILIGGKEAITPVGGAGVETLVNTFRLTDWSLERVGSDVLIHGRVNSD
jgi:diaminohydroxyphosphoribosylaminopyrimidine deaminase/5-amino-6-(5-phosphoribosylamino)uracil reductase